MAKTTLVNAATKAALIVVFPESTDTTVAAGLTADQITYLGNLIGKELQNQYADNIIKDLFTRIMAAV